MAERELRRLRDRLLAKAYAQQAKEKSNSSRSWISEEVRDLLQSVAMIEAMTAALQPIDTERLDEMGILKARLTQIEDVQVDNVANSLEQKFKAIYVNDKFNDAMHAHDLLEEGLCRFDSLKRELLRYRARLDDIARLG